MSDNFSTGLSLVATCSSCGKRLGVKLVEDRTGYKSDGESAPLKRDGTDFGIYNSAFKMEVTPCRQCIDAKTKPAENLAKAVKSMIKIAEQSHD